MTETAPATQTRRPLRRAPDDRPPLAGRRRCRADDARIPRRGRRRRLARGELGGGRPARPGLCERLLARGIGKGDAVGLLAQNGLDWALLDFALAQIGAVVVPIYASSSEQDVGYLLEHSDAVGVVARTRPARQGRGDRRRASAARARAALRRPRRPRRPTAATSPPRRPDALDEAAAAIDEDDLYTIIYTSGTTGPPKGCMLRHHNYYVMTSVVDAHRACSCDDDVMVLFLPLAHTFARLMHFAGADVGSRSPFSRSAATSGTTCSQLQPTLLPSVPRVFEKAYTAHPRAVQRGDRAQAPPHRPGDDGRPRRQARPKRGQARAAGLAAQHASPTTSCSRRSSAASAADCGFRSPAARRSARRSPSSSSRPASAIFEGYGLTECTTACSTNHADVPPRLGRPAAPGHRDSNRRGRRDPRPQRDGLPGLLRGPEATAEVLADDGWLHTGDIGDFDDDGFLYITDRKKDIIVTAGGKNVAPQNIENALKSTQYVSQALVVGDQKPYIAALSRSTDEIGDWAAEQRLDATSRRSSRTPEVQDARSRRRRRCEPRPLALRAGEALRDPAARLHAGDGRAHADAEAPPPRRPRALRGASRRALRAVGAAGARRESERTRRAPT